jgi:hypothetical protein
MPAAVPNYIASARTAQRIPLKQFLFCSITIHRPDHAKHRFQLLFYSSVHDSCGHYLVVVYRAITKQRLLSSCLFRGCSPATDAYVKILYYIDRHCFH